MEANFEYNKILYKLKAITLFFGTIQLETCTIYLKHILLVHLKNNYLFLIILVLGCPIKYQLGKDQEY